MPVRTRFGGAPTCAAPARPRIWVTHMRLPTQARGLYSRRQPSGRSGFSGSPAESEASRGTYEPNSVVHRKALTCPPFFLFFAYPWHAPPCHCLHPRARTEAGTHTGWHARMVTSALVFRPQDHCKTAQVWVGAPNQQLLLHQKGTHTQPTQSKRTLGTPRGRHGRYARQGSWVGERRRLVGHMAVCGGCTDTGKNPRITLAAGACAPKEPPVPNGMAMGNRAHAIPLFQMHHGSECNMQNVVVHTRCCGALARKVVFRITYLSYEHKLRG